MSVELKPCPFCGCVKSVAENNGKSVFWRVCANMGCGTEGPVSIVSQEEADAAWNHRAGEDKP